MGGVSYPHSKEEFPEPQWQAGVTLVLLSERKELSGGPCQGWFWEYSSN